MSVPMAHGARICRLTPPKPPLPRHSPVTLEGGVGISMHARMHLKPLRNCVPYSRGFRP